MTRVLLKRPFAFWLPAFGFLFFLWMWVDSCYNTTSLHLNFATRDSKILFPFRSFASRLEVGLEHTAGTLLAPGLLEPDFGRYKLHDHSYWWFPLPETAYHRDGGPGSGHVRRSLFIHPRLPHPLVGRRPLDRIPQATTTPASHLRLLHPVTAPFRRG